MSRPDKFDYIGMGLIALVVALWVAHFVLPPLPPEAAEPLEPLKQPPPFVR